jgi:hypothetical protein
MMDEPIPVPARSKSWVCVRSLAGIAVSNPAGRMDDCLFWVLCFGLGGGGGLMEEVFGVVM